MTKYRTERDYIDTLKDEERRGTEAHLKRPRGTAAVRDRRDAGRRAAEARRELAELEGTTALPVACRVSGSRIFYWYDGAPTCPTCTALFIGYRRAWGHDPVLPEPMGVPEDLDDLRCDGCNDQLAQPDQHSPTIPHAPRTAQVLVTEGGAVIDEWAHVLFDPAD